MVRSLEENCMGGSFAEAGFVATNSSARISEVGDAVGIALVGMDAEGMAATDMSVVGKMMMMERRK